MQGKLSSFKFHGFKALASELNMYHSQVNEYKYEIERLNREFQDFKKKYYQLRKKQQTEKRTHVNILKNQITDKSHYAPSAIEMHHDDIFTVNK